MDPAATKEKPTITLKLEENGHDSTLRVKKGFDVGFWLSSGSLNLSAYLLLLPHLGEKDNTKQNNDCCIVSIDK